MTSLEVLWFVLAMLVMGIGLVGAVVPAIPGTPLIFAAAVAHRLVVGDGGARTWVLVTLGILALLSLGADFAASVFGAKKLGAGRRGILGAVIGGCVGLFLGPIGILTGPFLGAFLFEYAGGREWKESAKAGAGATLGLFLGAVGKLACGVAMVFLFGANVVWRAFVP